MLISRGAYQPPREAQVGHLGRGDTSNKKGCIQATYGDAHKHPEGVHTSHLEGRNPATWGLGAKHQPHGGCTQQG